MTVLEQAVMTRDQFKKFSLQGISGDQARELLDKNRILFNRPREEMTTPFKLILSAIEKRATSGSPSQFEYHALGRAGEHIAAQFDAFNNGSNDVLLAQIQAFYNAAQSMSVALDSRGL
jgi:hypothetical protein